MCLYWRSNSFHGEKKKRRTIQIKHTRNINVVLPNLVSCGMLEKNAEEAFELNTFVLPLRP